MMRWSDLPRTLICVIRLLTGRAISGPLTAIRLLPTGIPRQSLPQLAEELLADIDKNTVDFTPNFDETTEEPLVLPSRVPNLIINGSSGIAVGMATNIPPHNLGEIIDGLVLLLENPDATLKDLMSHIKGPDFPTGGIIHGTDGIMHAYNEGKGLIKIRAKARIEREYRGGENIIVTELPYQVNKSRSHQENSRTGKGKNH